MVGVGSVSWPVVAVVVMGAAVLAVATMAVGVARTASTVRKPLTGISVLVLAVGLVGLFTRFALLAMLTRLLSRVSVVAALHVRTVVRPGICGFVVVVSSTHFGCS